MSHVDASALSSYNSLMDPHLSGYFGNNQMKRHLRKAGLIKRDGEIVSETTYRLQMARKEHKKHVRELLAQAIVHRTLDMERGRQVAIKQKLEEIAKIEMVRRVRTDRGRRGDEDILPLLTTGAGSRGGSRGGSRPSTAAPANRSRSSGARSRPRSAPNNNRCSSADSQQNVLVVDEDGMPLSPRSTSSSSPRARSPAAHKGRSSSPRHAKKQSKYPQGEIDDKHLYSLDRHTLYEYTMARQSVAQGHGPSPYHYPQLPPDYQGAPMPPSARNKSPRARPRTAKGSKEEKAQRKSMKQLMLHRKEPAMKHQERVQTLCDVTVHYFGSSLKLDYEKFDPRDDLTVEQQHCGGNTLPVFKSKVLPGEDFTFTSRRHRGYPFGLTFYINGVEDCRLSACCEYKHQSGSRLGGKKGHFGIVGVDGSSPCFKCQLNAESSNKKDKSKKDKKGKKGGKVEPQQKGESAGGDKETGRSGVDVQGYGDEETRRSTKDDIKVPVDLDDEDEKAAAEYDNDFEEEEEEAAAARSSRRKSRSSSRSSRSSRSKSSSSSGSRSRSRSGSSSRSTSSGTKRSDKAH